MIEPTYPNIDDKIIYILKFPNYGDFNSMPVFYLRSSLDSNFFVQTHVADTITESETMSKVNIFMGIIDAFLPNLPITSAGRDYKNGSDISSLTSGDNIELVD
jgi:hypothetical protein